MTYLARASILASLAVDEVVFFDMITKVVLKCFNNSKKSFWLALHKKLIILKLLTNIKVILHLDNQNDKLQSFETFVVTDAILKTTHSALLSQNVTHAPGTFCKSLLWCISFI